MPHRELNAAVVAVRLGNIVISQMNVKFSRTVFWSDSSCVLRWIGSPHCRFHVFVGQRVAEILESSTSAQWRYVPTASNPADDISRGLDAAELHLQHRWFTGPAFLLQSENLWPVTPYFERPEHDPEVRSDRWVDQASMAPLPIDDLVNNTSSLHRLLRIVALILRFITNSRSPITRRATGPLTASEIRRAREALIRRAQSLVYHDEIADLLAGDPLHKNSSIIKLAPYLNDRGMLCVGGRLGRADLPMDTRHPVLLPSRQKITRLILRDLHHSLCHVSAERLLHEARRTYWIPTGRTETKCVVSKASSVNE